MDSKKHILILTSWYPTENQPFLGNYVRQYAELLSQTCQVTVVSLEKNDKQGAKIVRSKINENFEEIKSFYSSSFFKLTKIQAHFSVLKMVKREVKNLAVLHVQIGLSNWWHFFDFQSSLGLPMVYTEHGTYFLADNLKPLSFPNRWGIKRLIRKADEVTAVSNLLSHAMKSLVPRSIHVIGNILPKSWSNQELSIEPLTNETYHFLHISTLNDKKNAEGILDAIALLKNENIADFQLTLLSDEPTEKLQAKALELGISDKINFLGPHSHDELPLIYQSHHCFVLNSNLETFSIVLAEAMFFGLHVISTHVGFVAQDSNAPVDFVEKNNPADLAEKMQYAAMNQLNSGQNGRNFVQKFSESAILEQYTELYDRLLENRK
ncbi:MAG: glycosyltransferase family 4 protein [Crocinitomicaceae bacterium]